jgi:hypothetical protein
MIGQTTERVWMYEYTCPACGKTWRQEKYKPSEICIYGCGCTTAHMNRRIEMDAPIMGRPSSDKRRMDFLEEFILTGVVTAGFEMDGGIHLTLSQVGDHEETALREKNTLREAIDDFMARRED